LLAVAGKLLNGNTDPARERQKQSDAERERERKPSGQVIARTIAELTPSN